MKDVLKQYLWIFSVTAGLLTAALLLLPDKKNRLEFIEEEIKKVQTQQKILTQKEKELERLATEKDWAEVDDENCTDDGCPDFMKPAFIFNKPHNTNNCASCHSQKINTN